MTILLQSLLLHLQNCEYNIPFLQKKKPYQFFFFYETSMFVKRKHE